MKIKLKFYKKFIDKKKYSIHLASKKDVKLLLNFINKYWKKNHIFVKSKKLFDFQHLSGNKLNWVLAKNKNSGNIEGILGLVSKNFFSNGVICKNDNLWSLIEKSGFETGDRAWRMPHYKHYFGKIDIKLFFSMIF